MDEKVQYWIDIAEYDLETATAMLNSRRFLYVGFMCHQVIEKGLKACFASVRAESPPFTHNLTYLAEQSGVYDDFAEDQKDLLDLLEPLNIEARYPTHKEKLIETLDEPYCREILLKTSRLYSWIKQRLSSV